MIEKRPFGRTGHDSTVTVFGGAAFMNGATQAQADATLEVLLEYGVNHIDTAPRYGDSELRIGPWMRGTANGSFSPPRPVSATTSRHATEIRRSLDRLQVDHVDLLHSTRWPIRMTGTRCLAHRVHSKR